MIHNKIKRELVYRNYYYNRLKLQAQNKFTTNAVGKTKKKQGKNYSTMITSLAFAGFKTKIYIYIENCKYISVK